MMISRLFAPVILLALWTASCELDLTGMNRKIDGSSEQAAQKSIETLSHELTPSDLQRFTAAYSKIAMRWAFGNFFSGQKNDSKELLRQIDGKTPLQIIEMAEKMDKSEAPASSTSAQSKASPSPIAAQIGKPFIIDGIQITIRGVRTGKLEKLKKQYSFGYVPDQPFLIIDVDLQNTTEGNIIYLQGVWEDSTITDNFGNVYDCPKSLALDRSMVQGAISSREFKPGETASDLMMFNVPLENAKSFVLVSDPNFWKGTGQSRLAQLSDTSFRLEFGRPDIK